MSNYNGTVSTETYGLLKRGMDASWERDKVISNNIANFNTKGFKRFDVVFEDNLKADDEGNSDLKLTNEKHINPEGNKSDIKIVRDESSSMRSDGNNVDVDTEMTNTAANAIMFNALVTEVNNRLSMRSYVIKGGK